MIDESDYLKFYDAEEYLLEEYLLEVGRRFRESGKLDAADFYMLLIWKANRAKNYHRDRLKDKSGSFQAAVSNISSELFASTEGKQRLQISWKGGGLRFQRRPQF